MKNIDPFVRKKLQRLNLNALYYFHLVAEEESISRVAKTLGISQPNLSQQISKLESQLGLVLFSRPGRQVKINKHGEALRKWTSSIFDQVEGLVSSLNYQRYDSADKQLRIGVSASTPKMIVANVLNPIFSDRSRTVHFSERPMDDLCDGLRNMDFDFFIAEIANPTQEMGEEIKSMQLMNPEYQVVMSPNLVESQDVKSGEGFDFNCLNGMKYFKFPSTNSVQRKIDQFFFSAGIKPLMIGECDDLHTAALFTLSNECFSILPKCILSYYSELCPVAPFTQIEPASLNAFYLADRDNEEEISAILEKVRY